MTKEQNICYCGNYGGGMHTRSARCPGGELRTPQGEPALTPPRELPGTREPVVREPQGNAGESPASTSSKTESFTVGALRARFADESMLWTRPHVESLINQIAELMKQRDEGWNNFYALRKRAAEEQYPDMTEIVRAHETTQPLMSWRLTDEHINSLQVASVDRLIKRAKAAHYVNVRIRINGDWEEHEADWIKHMKREPSLHQACLDSAVAEAIKLHGPPRTEKPLLGEPTVSTESDCSTGVGGVTLVQMAENIKLGLDPYTGSETPTEHPLSHLIAAGLVKDPHTFYVRLTFAELGDAQKVYQWAQSYLESPQKPARGYGSGGYVEPWEKSPEEPTVVHKHWCAKLAPPVYKPMECNCGASENGAATDLPPKA